MSVEHVNGEIFVTPSPDSQILYVSSSTGNDTNDGLSAAKPVATFLAATSKMRPGYPDHVLLMNGDTWSESLIIAASGRSPEEPVFVSSYVGTDGSLVKPEIHRTLLGRGRIAIKANFVVVKGFNLYGNGMDNALGVDIGFDNIHVEGITMQGYQMGFRFNGTPENTVAYVTVRNCRIFDSRGSGAYLPDVDFLTVENCIFDKNGPGDSDRDHGIYKSRGGVGHVYRNNFFGRSSGHGLKTRAQCLDYVIEGNVFWQNASSIGAGTDSDDVRHGNIDWNTVNTLIRNNVFVNGRTGMDFWIGSVDGFVVENNLFVDLDAEPYNAAMQFPAGNEYVTVQRRNVKIIGNTVVYASNTFRWATTNLAKNTSDGNEINNNIFEARSQPGKLFACTRGMGDDAAAGRVTLSGNTWYNDRADMKWFRWDDTGHTFEQWVALSGETDSVMAKVTWFDDTRTECTFAASKGLPATKDAFIEGIRNGTLSHMEFADYMREGFTEVSRQIIEPGTPVDDNSSSSSTPEEYSTSTSSKPDSEDSIPLPVQGYGILEEMLDVLKEIRDNQLTY